jgi:TolA-binding protein
MTCLGAAEIARIATTGDVPPHVRACVACRGELERQLAIRDALRALPVPRASAERVRAIKAEAMAASHVAPRWSPALAGALVLAAAAATSVFLLARTRSLEGLTPVAPEVAPAEPPELEVRVATNDTAPGRRAAAPSIAAHPGAVFSHIRGTQRDIVELADGAIDVDTRGARDVDVRIGRETVRVDDASVGVRAHGHAIVSVEVVVGSARVLGPEQQVTLEHDAIWTSQPVASVALECFRDGWVALRAGENRTAVALFDRATDPSVAEEASYWAAVAAMRAGDDADAKQRFAAFITRFPGSPYVEQARRALAAAAPR